MPQVDGVRDISQELCGTQGKQHIRGPSRFGRNEDDKRSRKHWHQRKVTGERHIWTDQERPCNNPGQTDPAHQRPQGKLLRPNAAHHDSDESSGSQLPHSSRSHEVRHSRLHGRVVQGENERQHKHACDGNGHSGIRPLEPRACVACETDDQGPDEVELLFDGQ